MTNFPEVKWFSNGSLINVIVTEDGETTQYTKTERVGEVIDLCKRYQYFLNHTGQELINDIYEELISILKNEKTVVNSDIGLLKDNDNYYFEGLENYPIPHQLEELIEQYNEQNLSLKPLKNFYHWLLLNPNQEAQEDLLNYVQDYSIVLTDNGYMMLYKGVVEVDTMGTDLAKFVSTEFINVISSADDPSEYNVYENPNWQEYPSLDSPYFIWWNQEDVDNAGFYEDPEYLGNLAELHNNIGAGNVSNTPLYTDWYNGTMNYTVGGVFSEDRDICDPDRNKGCSNGLHVGSYDYVSTFVKGWTNYAVFGCLVNPMNVVAVPTHDNSKIRTCEFKSLGLMEECDEGVFKKVDNLVLSDLEDDYLEKHVNDLSSTMGDGEVKDNIRKVIQL